MATDTVPAAVPGPPEPPGHTATNDQPAQGFLASMVAAVEPARPTTFDLTPTTPAGEHPALDDGALDRSAPGVTSASFRDVNETAGKDAAGEKRKAQGSIWKAWWLAGAQRWAKGGGATNKRLDLKKAKAQAHQVKESRTTAVTKSPGLPVRNSVGAGGGSKGNASKSGGSSHGKGPLNSSGNRSSGSGRGGSGGGRGHSGTKGAGGGSGSHGPTSGGRGTKDTKSPGRGGAGSHGGHSGSGTGGGSGAGKGPAGGEKNAKKTDGHGPAGKDGGRFSLRKASGTGTAGGGAGKQGSAGKNGKDGVPGKADGSGTDPKGAPKKHDLTKTPKDPKSGKGTGKDSAGADGHKTAKHAGPHKPAPEKTPLEKAREIGHGDGSKVRRVVDHVKAYTDGTRDGWDDEKTKNAKEHARLDKAHDKHKPDVKPDDKTKTGRTPAALITEPEDDGVTTDVKPLTVKSIDANTLTLGAEATRATYGRRELRNFKQYERKLEAKETVLQKIAEACSQLQKEAENEAKECQDLAEQAKSVKGGEKLGAKLNQLAEAAKNQAVEAAELARRAKRAAEMCKVVLTNIQTRYAPLYKAVVDSDETKPAELRFYNDKGSYAPAA